MMPELGLSNDDELHIKHSRQPYLSILRQREALKVNLDTGVADTNDEDADDFISVNNLQDKKTEELVNKIIEKN